MPRRYKRTRLFGVPQPLRLPPLPQAALAARRAVSNPTGLTPTADTWVSRSRDQRMVAVRVEDMEPAHLFRWINYFRNKYRANILGASNDALDAVILKTMVTAPAIYARAVSMGLIPRPGGEASALLPPTEQRVTVTFEAGNKPVPLAGRRKMTFEDEDV